MVECMFDGKLVAVGQVVASEDGERPGLLTTVAVFAWYSLCWIGRLFTSPLRIF